MPRPFSTVINALAGIRMPTGAAAGKIIGSDGSGNFSWIDPPTSSGGAADIKQATIDFGTTPTSEASFVVSDAAVTATSQIVGIVALEAAGTKQADEVEMDTLSLRFAPAAGSFTIHVRCETGRVTGPFKINYLVG